MSVLKLILKIVCGLAIVAVIAVGAYYLINKFVGSDDDEDWDEFDCFECACDDCEGCEPSIKKQPPSGLKCSVLGYAR